MNYKPYLRFHLDELKFDGKDWQVAFTPRGITWEPKQVRPVPDEEMRRIWKGCSITDALDEAQVKRHWALIEGSVRSYLIREYWDLSEAQE